MWLKIQNCLQKCDKTVKNVYKNVIKLENIVAKMWFYLNLHNLNLTKASKNSKIILYVK